MDTRALPASVGQNAPYQVIQTYSISEHEFLQIRDLLHRHAGIYMTKAKIPLVVGRLSKRLRHLGLADFSEYLRMIVSGLHPEEFQILLDLLATHETRFFREPAHFEFLQEHALARAHSGRPLRVWSAACSSGEEPYSIAMVLADILGERPWEIVASDLSTRILEHAQIGVYAMERASEIMPNRLRRHCLKGTGQRHGTFLIEGWLRRRMQFRQININAQLPSLGLFDAIFLRNVMIYFDSSTKQRLLRRMLPLLRPDGHIYVGHTETLNGVTDGVESVAPSIYRRK